MPNNLQLPIIGGSHFMPPSSWQPGKLPPKGYKFGPNGELIPINPNGPSAPNMIRTGDFRDANGNGIDDRDEPAPYLNVQPIPGSGIMPGLGQQPGSATIENNTGSALTGPPAPPTGLIGAEQALRAGAEGSTGALMEGYDVARGDVLAGAGQAGVALDAAGNAITTGITQGRQDVMTAAGTGRDLVQQGTAQGDNALAGSTQKAHNILAGGGAQAHEQLGQGIDTVTAAGTQAGARLEDAGAAAMGSIDQGVTALESAKTEGLSFLNQAFDQAVDPITGFIDPGKKAQVLQAALTGAMGPEAQLAAIENFATDPGTMFAAKEAEKALLRNASAMGGVGGGNVRKALVRQAVGESQKNFNTRIQQLGQQAAMGLQAAQSVGQLEATRGVTGTDLIGRTGESVARLRESGAGLQQNLGLAQADVLTNTARTVAGLRESGAMVSADLASLGAQLEQATGQSMASLIQAGAISEADIAQSAGNTLANLSQAGGFRQADVETKRAMIEESLGLNLADLANSTGINVANIIENLGANSAELRTQAGKDLATAIGTASSQLAELQQTEGAGVSDIVGAQVGNVAEILLKEGLLDSQSQEAMATLLGNLAVGEGSTAAQIATNVGNIEAAGVLGKNTAVQGAVSGLAEAYEKWRAKNPKKEK